MPLYRFDQFSLDASERRLLKNGQSVPLKAKVFDLLLLLVGRDGHLVRKEELMKAVWPDSFVEDNNLTVGISALRKVLGERADGPQYIETVPRLGYRFVADLQVFGNGTVKPKECLEGAAMAAAFDGGTRAFGLLSAIGSLAILPFELIGLESADQCLSVGIAGTLVTKLSVIKHLNVLPTRKGLKYLQLKHEPPTVGQQPEIISVLEGQLQKSENRIRVIIQIISTSDERLLWAEKFDGEYASSFAIQDFVSEHVLQELTQRLAAGDGGTH